MLLHNSNINVAIVVIFQHWNSVYTLQELIYNYSTSAKKVLPKRKKIVIFLLGYNEILILSSFWAI